MIMIHFCLKVLAIFASFQMVCCFKLTNKEIAILGQMQDWGKAFFRQLENKHEPKDKGQYLVAAMISDAALDKPHDFTKFLHKGCPNGPDMAGKMIECDQSAVILNKENEKTWENSAWKDNKQYRNHPWHGEYRLINEGIIERLINNFHSENGPNAICRVYLYSYYIPCADITNCPYSCSDQVAAYNSKAKCKITVIGYTEVFKRPSAKTNEARAKNVIIRAEIDLLQTLKGQGVTVEAIKDVREKIPLSFQELMYSCLYNSPMSGCCVDNTESGENKEPVIAYFVNNIVYKAVNDEKFKNRRFSAASRKDFDKFFLELFEERIHTDCSKCRFSAFLVGFCSKTALDLASGFGKPLTPNDLSSAKWEEPYPSWENLYNISPEQFRNTKMIMCAYKPLSVDSLCTRLESDTLLRKRGRSYSPSNSKLKMGRQE